MSDMQPIMTIQPQSNPWQKISEVAARVGVNPCKGGKPPTITALGVDGNSYDVWEVIIAVLDRLDRAAVDKAKERHESIAELTRLRASNAELVAALKDALGQLHNDLEYGDEFEQQMRKAAINLARAAVDKEI